MALDPDPLYEVINGQPVLLSDHVVSAVIGCRLADLLNERTATAGRSWRTCPIHM